MSLKHNILSAVLFLCYFTGISAQQFFTNGISIINAPSAGSPAHAGSNLPISVEISGNGRLSQNAANPASSESTHYFSLEMFLVSSETNTNLTVASGTDFLTSESGTVRHLNWPVPTCVPAGQYNLTFYEYSQVNGEPFFIITPVSIPVQNSNPSGACTEADGLNVLQEQPQEASLPNSSPFDNSSNDSDVLLTITLDGSVPLELPTRTVTQTAPLSTVVILSMETVTTVQTGQQGTVTSVFTQTYTSTTVMPQDELSGFIPVNDGSRIRALLLIPSALTFGIIFAFMA